MAWSSSSREITAVVDSYRNIISGFIESQLVGMHLESRVTCGSKEVRAWADDSTMELVDIGAAADCDVRIL